MGEMRRTSLSTGTRTWYGAMLAALVMTMVIPSAAQAGIRYAGPGGVGSEPCSDAMNPCGIETAVEGSVANGDEIVVQPGTYTISNTLTVDDAVSVHGVSGQARPKVVNSGTDGIIVVNAGAVVRGLDVEHSGSSVGLNIALGLAE